jgi:hypothetical protein
MITTGGPANRFWKKLNRLPLALKTFSKHSKQQSRGDATVQHLRSENPTRIWPGSRVVGFERMMCYEAFFTRVQPNLVRVSVGERACPDLIRTRLRFRPA